VADQPIWTDGFLDELRELGDPDADAVAERFFKELENPAEAAEFFRVGRGSRDHPVVAAWLAEEVDPPAWVDFDRINRGAAFFCEHGLEIGIALFCSALPLGYACAEVANVLEMTMQLESNTRHRALETAQMVLNATAPDGLKAGKAGFLTVRQVRLMHAGVRWLVQNDPDVIRRHSRGMADVATWDPTWKMPVSQEHMLGALTAFNVRSLMALDTMHIDYDSDAAEDFMHLWSYVGYLMGIDERALPIDHASGLALDALLMKRDIHPTPAGRRLTAAIHDLLDDIGPARLLRGLPRAASYALLGAELATALGVRDPGWERWLFNALTMDLRIGAAMAVRNRLVRTAIRHVGRAIMVGFVDVERHEGRPAFEIPQHLHDPWRIVGKVPAPPGR
jgi:hypothetical protein